MKLPFAVVSAAGLVALSGPWLAAFAVAPVEEGHVLLLAEDLVYVDGPAGLPPGVRFALLEGDLSSDGPFTFRLVLPANYRIPPHRHPSIEHLTVLSGTFHLGMGETFDAATATALPVGGFFAMPTGMDHYAFTGSEETVVQIHGDGRWGITYVDPADDPTVP